MNKNNKVVNEHLDKCEKKSSGELGRVIAIFALLLFFIYMFYMASPGATFYNGGVLVEDSITGFKYFVDNDLEEIILFDVIDEELVKDGYLEIPNSIWGIPVTKVSMERIKTEPRIVSVYIPDNVRLIWRLYVEGMKEVTGGRNVREIGQEAFEVPYYIDSEVNDDLERIVLGNRVEQLNDRAFANCIALKEVKLGNSLYYIGDYAFYGCTSLEEIELGYSVTNIQTSAFEGCTSLQKVSKIGTYLKTKGTNAFAGTPWALTSEGQALLREIE